MPADKVPGWSTIKTERVFSHPVLNLDLVARRGDSGREHDFLVLRAPDWVNVIALTDDGRIVLIRQWRQGVAGESLEIPGGIIDPGESPEQAGARELLEETGYAGGEPERLGWVRPNPALFDNRCHTVLIRDARPVAPQRPDDTEQIMVLTRPWSQVSALVAGGEIDHALVLAAFGLCAARGAIGS